MLLAVTGSGQQPLPGVREGSEAMDRFAPRFVGRSPGINELLGAQQQVQPDLLVDLLFPTIAPSERQSEEAPYASANHAPTPFGAVSTAVMVSAYCSQLRVSARRCERPAAVIV